MNSQPTPDPAAQSSTASQTSCEIATPAPLEDDLDFSDVKLSERQPEACSMEEGCERCQ